jgi:hypothetical protein
MTTDDSGFDAPLSEGPRAAGLAMKDRAGRVLHKKQGGRGQARPYDNDHGLQRAMGDPSPWPSPPGRGDQDG